MSSIEKVLEALMGNKSGKKGFKFPGGELQIEQIDVDQLSDAELLAKIDSIQEPVKKRTLQAMLWKREWRNIDRQGQKDGTAFEFIDDSYIQRVTPKYNPEGFKEGYFLSINGHGCFLNPERFEKLKEFINKA